MKINEELTPQQQRNRDHYLANKETIKARNKKWREDNPEKAKAAIKNWRKENKEHEAKVNKAYRENNKAKVKEISRRKHLRLKYGLTVEAFDKMLSDQDNACAACSRTFDDITYPCVDHCHATGKLRSLLCDRCNRTAGHAGDDPEILRCVAVYLEHHRSR